MTPASLSAQPSAIVAANASARSSLVMDGGQHLPARGSARALATGASMRSLRIERGLGEGHRKVVWTDLVCASFSTKGLGKGLHDLSVVLVNHCP